MEMALPVAALAAVAGVRVTTETSWVLPVAEVEACVVVTPDCAASYQTTACRPSGAMAMAFALLTMGMGSPASWSALSTRSVCEPTLMTRATSRPGIVAM
jgi:hypothetical protein